MNFDSDNTETYNKPIKYQELIEALDKTKNTVAGSDNIHAKMLKKLPDKAKIHLLRIYLVVKKSQFPKQWQHAVVVPIAKLAKDYIIPINYRPIALNQCYIQNTRENK